MLLGLLKGFDYRRTSRCYQRYSWSSSNKITRGTNCC